MANDLPNGPGAAGREGRPARRRPDRARLRDEGRQPDPRRGGAPRRRGAPPDGGGRADLRGARPDEGRGDEGRPGGLVHRHRRLPARVPGAHPGEARRAARRGAARAVRAHAQGHRGRPGREARRRVRRVRRGGRGGRLDRPGLPRAPARRTRRGGQGAVPGRGPGGARRPPEPGADHARGEADRARHGRQGDDRRDPRAPHRRARLRARGAAAPRVRPHLARPPVHLRAGGGHRAVHASTCS